MEKQVSRTYAQAVEIAVNFWVEKSFNTKMNQNNGSERQGGGGFAMILANLGSMNAQGEVTPEKVEKFKEKLTERLLSGEGKGRWERECDVDYNPCSILSEACKYAEINPMCLPIKTFTFIEKDNSVTGRYQYGGEFFTL